MISDKKQTILVTGGTGFIGSHTVREFLKQGHSVNLFVRSRQKAEKLFPGEQNISIHEGDLLDSKSLESAAEGCTALFHCGAMVSLNLRKQKEMFHINNRAAENIVSVVRGNEIKKVIFVSSCTALFHPDKRIMTEKSPRQKGFTPYGKSKAESEEIIMQLSREDIDLSIVYPSSVIGPDDPGLSEANNALIYLVKYATPLTSGGFQFIDVRDLALIHAGLMTSESMEPSVLGGGHFFRWRDLYKEVRKISPRKIPLIPVPAFILRFLGRIISMIQRFTGIKIHLTYEGALYMTRWNIMDDSESRRQTGVKYRNADETLKETALWLRREGFLKKNHIHAEDSQAWEMKICDNY